MPKILLLTLNMFSSISTAILYFPNIIIHRLPSKIESLDWILLSEQDNTFSRPLIIAKSYWHEVVI